jgi:predicted nucleic acid-binding protein
LRIGVDTNLLVYAELSGEDDRSPLAADILYRLSLGAGVVTPQVLGELFNVLTRKGGRTRRAARSSVQAWQSVLEVIYPDRLTFAAALDLAVDHNLQIWDALILSTFSDSGCDYVLSEDMHHGFTWQGTMVMNPFATGAGDVLEQLLSDL